MVVWERGEGEAMSGVRRGDGRRGARARTARGTGMRAGGWRAAGLKAAGERRRRVPSCRSRSFRRSCECKQQQQTVAPRSAFLNLRGGAMRACGRGGRAQGERLVKLDDLRVVRREGSDAARGRKGYGCHQRKAHAAGGSGIELWGTICAPLDRQLVYRRHECGKCAGTIWWSGRRPTRSAARRARRCKDSKRCFQRVRACAEKALYYSALAIDLAAATQNASTLSMAATHPSTALSAALRCAACGDYRVDARVLPCAHRFCRRCLKSMPNCITCKQSHFEREEVSDPYNEGMIDAFSVVVDQARVNGCLHEPGGAAAATASIAPPPTAEMAKVAAERAVLRERMEITREAAARAPHAHPRERARPPPRPVADGQPHRKL